jgi:hypothetical protein
MSGAPGIEPGPPRWEASTVEKSHWNSLFNCLSEPLHCLNFTIFIKGDFFLLYVPVLYSKMPAFRFHYVGGCWDRTPRTVATLALGAPTTRLDLVHLIYTWSGCNIFCRRWTEVFLIKTSGGESGRGREADPTRVAESVARAVGVALSPALTRLKQEGLSPLAVRVTLDQDNVSGHFYGLHAQSTELNRGAPELVQHFRLSGKVTSEQACCPKFDMVWVWQYLSPISVGRKGIISSLKWFLPCLLSLRGSGVEVGTLWLYVRVVRIRVLTNYFSPILII